MDKSFELPIDKEHSQFLESQINDVFGKLPDETFELLTGETIYNIDYSSI